MNKADYAEVYLIISPSGKKYVGKANCLTCKNKEHGTLGRWKTHIYDSRKSNGGRCRLLNEEIRKYDSDSVRELMSLKRRSQPSKGPPKESTRKMISDTLISNVKRYDHNNNQLPKYVKHVKWNDRIGYQVVSHPLCKCKYFVSKKESLDDLYHRCIIFLDSLHIKGTNC